MNMTPNNCPGIDSPDTILKWYPGVKYLRKAKPYTWQIYAIFEKCFVVANALNVFARHERRHVGSSQHRSVGIRCKEIEYIFCCIGMHAYLCKLLGHIHLFRSPRVSLGLFVSPSLGKCFCKCFSVCWQCPSIQGFWCPVVVSEIDIFLPWMHWLSLLKQGMTDLVFVSYFSWRLIAPDCAVLLGATVWDWFASFLVQCWSLRHGGVEWLKVSWWWETLLELATLPDKIKWKQERPVSCVVDDL